jgi:hypothetical protein
MKPQDQPPKYEPTPQEIEAVCKQIREQGYTCYRYGRRGPWPPKRYRQGRVPAGTAIYTESELQAVVEDFCL